MKKNFPLSVPGKAGPRVLDTIKHDVRKYVKRERRKPLPAGFDLWEFDCQVARGDGPLERKALGEISRTIDVAAGEGCATVRIEILARAARRVQPLAPPAPESGAAPVAATL